LTGVTAGAGRRGHNTSKVQQLSDMSSGSPVSDPLTVFPARTSSGRNWRGAVIRAAFRLQNPDVLRELEVIQSVERSPVKLQATHETRLEQLLHHAWSHTDYYREVLEACGAVRSGKVHLDRFEDIPFLTKDIICSQGDRLIAKSLPAGRKAHRNRSGGSTGQPVRFWQDNVYWGVTIATRTHHFSTVGKELGQREMKIWGNEPDLRKGTIGWKVKLENFVYNRRFEQCWYLPERRILEIIRHINEWQPQMLWCFRDGIDGVARYINDHGVRVHSPASVVLGGATVYPFMAKLIETAFKSPAISAYGSREVGAVACQCLERGGLHIATQAHKVEVIGPDERPILGADGELAITPLTNYAMPFIRYRIGDRGRMTQRHCACGRAFPMLDGLTGRVVEVLRNPTGEQIDPGYFIWIMAEKINNKVLKKGQIVQEEDGAITVNLVLGEGATRQEAQPHLEAIRQAIALVMGPDGPVRFEFPDDIPLSASGKFPYIVRRATLQSASSL
jgi:phenylacetate-coenzyme A ligase PaaK-like adenylate-forming protein